MAVVSAQPGCTVMWAPSPTRVESSGLTAFARYLLGLGLIGAHQATDYVALHAWSVAEREQFWAAIWDFCDVFGERGQNILCDGNQMPGARWFPEARLNFAENLLRYRDDQDAVVFWGEDKIKERVSRSQLYRRVAHLAAALRDLGITPGDRIAAYMPNTADTVVAMLASASLGATFTSASPDFGVAGILDRFGQVGPKVLFATDGYYYNGKTIDVMHKLPQVVAGLPTLEKTIVVHEVRGSHDLTGIAGAVMLEDFVAAYRYADEIDFVQLPFDHPLYILYSSGTTGVPKCIVHGAGGTLLQHLKEHRIHGDIHPGDRLFFYTTCGWMMWNWLVSGLGSGATVLLYDGSPFAVEGDILFDFAEAEHATHFGVSAKFLEASAKAGCTPGQRHRFDALRVIFSTGSPLIPDMFDYVYRQIKADVHLASISGGTDILSCFVLGNPNAPVYRGQIQCPGLGMAVEVDDEGGHPLEGVKGELVCALPFPAMPIGFLNDSDGMRYRAAYFERIPGVWCHGDYIEQTQQGGYVIHGRSDATLNPGGVRIGTAEIYQHVGKVPEVVECVAVSQDWPPSVGTEPAEDVRVVLFVVLRQGVALDTALEEKIRATLRTHASPRHVPARILQVAEIPRTKSGKIVELAVRNVVHGEPVKNLEALANPEALDHFRDRPELAH